MILNTARPMNHELLDKLKQHITAHRELSGHEAINVSWRAQLELRLKEDNDVGMRKATLLKLNGVEVGIDVTQHSIFDVSYESIQFDFKDTNHQVRMIRGSLNREEV